MSQLKNLYTYLIDNRKHERQWWRSDYEDIVTRVKHLRDSLKASDTDLNDPGVYATDSFESKEKLFDRLFANKGNGVASPGPSSISPDNLEKVKKDTDFLMLLKDLIVDPNKKNHDEFRKIWVEKINGSSLSRLFVLRRRTVLQNRFLYNANQRPGLSLGQWTAFTDFNLVADTTFVVLVMYVQFGRTFDEFTVDRVFHKTFDSNNNGFLHFVANYATLQSTDFIGHYAPAF